MTVYLVGAGPGDPGLLTLRGRQLLERCDALVYDRLADPRIVAMARAGAELHDAGKQPGRHTMTQDQINELLVELGGRHQTVVRLKGGDPFIFGRGGEEALALDAAGIAWEVVPGISSAYAVPAYAGIPVTHRGDGGAGHDRHRPRGSGEAGHRSRLGAPGADAGHAGLPDGRLVARGEHGPAARRGSGAGDAGRGHRLGHPARPAHRVGHGRHHRRGGRPGGDPAARDHAGRRGRRAPRPARLVRAAAAVRPAGGGHPGPGTGQRPGRPAGRAGRGRAGGAGHHARGAALRARPTWARTRSSA